MHGSPSLVLLAKTISMRRILWRRHRRRRASLQVRIGPRRAGNGAGRLNAAPRGVEYRTPVEPPKKTFAMRDAVVLDINLSAKLRDEMIAELNDLGTGYVAARWAKSGMIDQFFRTKLALCGATILSRLRSIALRRSPPALCANARSRAQGQRRVHRAAMPRTPSRAPSPRRQGQVVEKDRD